jgi:hypothetical protein
LGRLPVDHLWGHVLHGTAETEGFLLESFLSIKQKYLENIRNVLVLITTWFLTSIDTAESIRNLSINMYVCTGTAC